LAASRAEGEANVPLHERDAIDLDGVQLLGRSRCFDLNVSLTDGVCRGVATQMHLSAGWFRRKGWPLFTDNELGLQLDDDKAIVSAFLWSIVLTILYFPTEERPMALRTCYSARRLM
jgi:hypothetical protein